MHTSIPEFVPPSSFQSRIQSVPQPNGSVAKGIFCPATDAKPATLEIGTITAPGQAYYCGCA